MDEWIKNIIQLLKNGEFLPFATIWMDLEGITLSEISQTEKDKYCSDHMHVEPKQKQKQQTNPKLKERKDQICGYQSRRVGREGVGGTWSKCTNFAIR